MAHIAVAAPVREVTVMEDRACVVRAGSVALPAGASTLVIAGTAIALSDRTVSGRLQGPAPARTLHVRVIRRPRISVDDRRPLIHAVEEELRAATLAHQALQEESRLLEAELKLLGQAGKSTLADIAEDAAWSRDGRDEWRSSLEGIRDQERRAFVRLKELSESASRGSRGLQDLKARLESMRQPQGEFLATVEIEIQADAAGTYELTLSYLVPGACWRPYHTARLIEDGPPRVDIGCDACVWQCTGEDWANVTLRCSTERPSLGTAPPLLASDTLTLGRRERQVVVEALDQAVQTIGGAAGVPSDELMGVDDGGEPLLLACEGAVTVPNDGMPHRVPLFSVSSPATAALVVIGELVPGAILRTRQANSGSRPLLAGPVDLIRRGGLAGRSALLFVAGGAEFDLGWGPEGDIRVQRETSEHDEKSGMLSNWVSTVHEVRIHLSNLGDQERTLEICERIPVSSVPQVQIELDAAVTRPLATADANGFVRWQVSLPDHQQRTVVLRFRLRKQANVVGV